MKTRNYLLSCAALFFAAACTSEAVVDTPSGSATMYFTASFEAQPGTRTELQPDGTSFFWSAHEGIMIYTSDGFSGAFTSDNEEPAATATFSGTFDGIPGPAAEFYAIYGGCSDEDPIHEGNFVVSEAPSTDYGFSGFSIDSQEVWRCYPAVSKAQGRSLYFQHVCGGARFCVSQPGITKVSFESKGGDRLVSKVGVSFNASGAVESVQPIVEPGEDDGYNKLTINAPEGGFAPGEYYYAPMIAGEHPEGLDITYFKDDGSSATYSLSKPVTIHRAVFGKLDNLDAGLTFSNPDAPIQFADAYVKAVLVANFDTNADGEISYREAAAVTDLGTAFKNNEDIKTFNELSHFSGLSCIAEEAFFGCKNLESTIVPENVKTFGNYAFYNCRLLSAINIPEGVTEIGQSAFYNCRKIRSVELPLSLTSLGTSAFVGCQSLERFAGKYSSDDGRILVVNNSLMAFAPAGITDYDIPSGITSLASHAFDGCWYITHITIPYGVMSMGECAFGACKSLESIIIPDSVTSLGYYETFMYCESLHSVKLPQGITEIPFQCFENCTSLLSITIPAGVSEINNRAFMHCISLKSVTVLAENPPSLLGQYAFDDTNDCPIYVPAASVGAYKAEQNWNRYASRIFAIREGAVGEAIDLGLPSGLKWASCNVGASSPEDYGDYFAWGETEPKTTYNWSTYKFRDSGNTDDNVLFNKYCPSDQPGYWGGSGEPDNNTVLDANDDAASENWGGSWRIATMDEWIELMNECSWTWTTINGKNGRLVTGANGNSIFLPAAGFMHESSVVGIGSFGNYWSSSLLTVDSYFAIFVEFKSVDTGWLGSSRYCGYSVRPVTE